MHSIAKSVPSSARQRIPRREVRRVLMTADAMGGVWTYTVELARALSTRGVEIAVATMGARPSRDQSAELARLPRTHVFESDFKIEWMDDPWGDVERAGAWLVDIERGFRPDVVHLNGYVHAALPWKAPVISVAHSCVLSWWAAVRGVEAPSTWNLYRRFVRRGILAADAVIAPSHAMLAQIHRWYGKPALEAVIPNGRDPRSFGVSKKQAYIFSFGRLWDEAKNISAIDAVARDLEWPVFIAGNSISPAGDSVHVSNGKMVGPLGPAHLRAWLAAASICAFPARYEPFGLCALEAALSGCALVLGDIESLRENWDGAALFVAPEDRIALRDALAELIRKPKLRDDLAKRANDHASTFNSNRTASAYLEIYRTVMERHTPGAERLCAS
jgi:glycogen synthase